MRATRWDGETTRERVEGARLSTRGVQRIVRKRGKGSSLPDSERAEEWAKTQPWWPRVVLKGCDARHWVWLLAPEGGR